MSILYIEFENNPCRLLFDKVDNPVHRHMFHLKFENGYENIFFTDIETCAWIEQDLGYTNLAKAFGQLIDEKYIYEGNGVKRRITWFSKIMPMD